MKYIFVSQVKCLAFIIFCLASNLACVRHQPDDLAEGQDGVSTEEVNPFAAFADDADPSRDGETNVLSATPNNPQAKVDETAVQSAVSALKKLRARIKRDANGDVKMVELMSTKITDAGLEHFKGLTELEALVLHGNKITDAGVAELQKALPNCKIQ